jgi:hypothetical protein
MENKEKLYDEQISPLIKKVLSICKEHKIPMFCEFQFSDEGFCRSFIKTQDNTGQHSIWKYYAAMSQCKEGNTINIDKFLMWVLKTFDNSGSVFLYEHQKGNI